MRGVAVICMFRLWKNGNIPNPCSYLVEMHIGKTSSYGTQICARENAFEDRLMECVFKSVTLPFECKHEPPPYI